MTVTTWNSSDQSNQTLSNGSLTSTANSATEGGVRATTSVSSGKIYHEFTLGTIGGSNYAIGWANSTASLTAALGLGSTKDSVAGYPNFNQDIFINNVVVSHINARPASPVLQVAFDLGASLIWFRYNGSGNWNNTAGADPATGTSGLSTASLNAGPYFPVFGTNSNAASVTANFGVTTFSFTPPSGFSGLDGPGTLNLSGVSATSGTGALTISGADQNVALTGIAATTAAATLLQNASLTLSGASATGQAGSLIQNPAITPTGVSATSHAGTLTVQGDVSVALSGVAATAHANSLAFSSAETFTGVSATTSAGTFTISAATPLGAVSATAGVGTIVTQVTTTTTSLELPLTGIGASTAFGTLNFDEEPLWTRQVRGNGRWTRNPGAARGWSVSLPSIAASTAVSAVTPSAPPSYTGPLDLTATPAVVAYGQRAMKTAQIGNTVYTLRRDSDDATMAFPSAASGGVDPSTVLAWAAGANVFVTAWDDGSGNGADALQATAALQPKWLAAGPNSRPQISFDGVAQFLATASAVNWNSNNFTAFFVNRVPSGLSSPGGDVIGIDNEEAGPDNFAFFSVLGQGDGTMPGSVFAGNAADALDVNQSGARARPLLSEDTYYLFDQSWGATANSWTGFYNGNAATIETDFTAGTGVIGPLPFRMALGADDAINPGATFGGYIVEAFIFLAILSDADRTAIRQNIAAWYGITLP